MIIDFHTHVGDLRARPTDAREPITFENLIARLDDEGIDKAVLLPIYASPEGLYPAFVTGAGHSIHDQVLAAARYADRIICFGSLDPRWPGNNRRGDFSPYLDWFLAHGCQGIGEVTANIPFDDLRMVNMARQCGERRLCIVFHGCGFEPGAYGLQDDPGAPRLERLLREAPETNFAGHGPGFWADISVNVTPADKMGYPTGPVQEGALARLLRAYPNLFCDISAGSGHNALTRDVEYGVHFLNEFQDRVLFATDVCFAGPEDRMPHLGWLRGLLAEGKISQTLFDKITGGNAQRLLRKP